VLKKLRSDKTIQEMTTKWQLHPTQVIS